MKTENKHGIGIISIIISLLVGAILIIVAITIYTGGKTGKDSAVTSPIERAKNIECIAQIKKIETSIQTYLAENARYPERLEDLKDLSIQNIYCPVTNRPYYYDSNVGKVSCPGHQ